MRSYNLVLQSTGIKNCTKSKKSAKEIWECLLDEEMLNMITNCTNIKRHCTQFQQGQGR
ncbi:unnamed protein product [Acanthoscelides obtectus]|uniref:Uncharacterized protein n=1 Tax=Acanthoscelides obtectus TaxID=200917 RepID=A0A9P0PY35_ACAOB|nr:unnamed protein product [Acanthoscelides obtectus]CAK1667060.1 hypothetical protein AOBTE_LOCUS25653 [Acanthoscelides obtectus]